VEGKRKPLDYKQFARDAASGKFTQSKLAEKYDYSLSMIKKIVAGQRRPEAQELIEKAREEVRMFLMFRGLDMAEMAMETLIRAMGAGSVSAAVTAAREVLNRIAGRPACAAPEREPKVKPWDKGESDYEWLRDEYDKMSESTRMRWYRDMGGDVSDAHIAAADARDAELYRIKMQQRESERPFKVPRWADPHRVEMAESRVRVVESELAEARGELEELKAGMANNQVIPDVVPKAEQYRAEAVSLCRAAPPEARRGLAEDEPPDDADAAEAAAAAVDETGRQVTESPGSQDVGGRVSLRPDGERPAERRRRRNCRGRSGKRRAGRPAYPRREGAQKGHSAPRGSAGGERA